MNESQPPIERRIVTILFADLVGFTPLSERLDAEDVASVQDAYFGLVRETIQRHGGHLEKFIGDAAMAVFGLVRARDDDAERAVRAGLALANGVDALGGRLGLEVGELRLRVGINTGEVVTVEGGPDRGRVTGDAVNAAARLQTAAEPGRVLLGELTALSVADVVELEAVGPLQLKGKAEPVRPSLVTSIRLERSREEAMGGLRAPLLGRANELVELSRAANGVAEGAHARILVVAQPGVGKTRLLDEFASSLVGFRILRARLRPDAGSPFEAVVQLMHAAFGHKPEASLAVRLAAAGVSDARATAIIGDVASLIAAGGVQAQGQESEPPTSSSDRAAAFDAWVTALDSADDGAVAWLIEDLHWAGPDLLAFLDAAQELPRSGRLVLATARPSLLERVARDAWTIQDLAPLQADHAGALVRALVGGALPAALLDRIVQRSDGNCLFIEELLRTWIATGTMVTGKPAGTWVLAVPVDEAPLPATVQAIYAGQLDDLPGSARSAARQASVAGRRFPEAALETLGVDDVPGSIGILLRRALISGPMLVAVTGDAYSYRHALLQDAAYASLARAERARLHVLLARWLEMAAGTDTDDLADEIATHYEAAVTTVPSLAAEVADGLTRDEATDLAATWLERAGNRALLQFANTAARSAFERSVRMTRADAPMDAARRWQRLGEATLRDGELEEAAESFATSATTYRALLTDGGSGEESHLIARRGLATAAAAEARIRYEQIRFAEAQGIADAALEITGRDDPQVAVPLLLARLLAIEGLTNEYAALRDEATEVLALAEAHGDPELIFSARRAVLTFGSSAGTTTADDWLASAEEARRLGHWREAAGATLTAASIASDLDAARARALASEAEQIAGARGLSEPMAWIGQMRAELGLQDGEWAAALEDSLRTLDLAELHHYDRAAVRTWFVATAIADAISDDELLQRAARWFDSHRGLFPSSPYSVVMHAGVELRLAAHGLASSPDLDRERVLAGFGLADTSPSWLCSIERIVEGLLERGDAHTAAEGVETFCTLDVGEVVPLTNASRALVRGWVARSAGRTDDAATLFAEALTAARDQPAPWWVARSLRGLETCGTATDIEIAEAAAIESRLGVASSG